METDRVTADAWSDHHRQPQPYTRLGTWSSSPMASGINFYSQLVISLIPLGDITI